MRLVGHSELATKTIKMINVGAPQLLKNSPHRVRHWHQQIRNKATDAATEESQTRINPAVSATAAASSARKKAWFQVFFLDTELTIAGVSAITQSEVQAPRSSTMIANYSTLRHLPHDRMDLEDRCTEEAFVNHGVTSETDRTALQTWTETPRPCPHPAPLALPPPPVVAATVATVARQVSAAFCSWSVTKISVAKALACLTNGRWSIVGAAEVIVRFGPKAAPDYERAIVFVAGSNGYSNDDFSEAMHLRKHWPTEWEVGEHCIVAAIPTCDCESEEQMKKSKSWSASLPPYVDAILAWLAQLGVFVLLVAFSRWAAWCAQLHILCPTNIRGVLLLAGFRTHQEASKQLQAARDLLKPRLPVGVVRASFPTRAATHHIGTQKASTRGESTDERNEELGVITTQRFDHVTLEKFAEGFTDEPPFAETCGNRLLHPLGFLLTRVLVKMSE